MAFSHDVTATQALLWMVRNNPGLTEAEMAVRMHGTGGYQQQVNANARWLEEQGLIERREVDGVNRLHPKR